MNENLNKLYVIAFYWPSGNIFGKYLENVKPPVNSQQVQQLSTTTPLSTTGSNKVVPAEFTRERIDQVNSECLEEHNRVRALHGAPKLTLNKALVALAGIKADDFASRDDFKRENFTLGSQVIGQSWVAFDYKPDITGLCFGLFIKNNFLGKN